ncbi:PspC domain-containing protein [Nocardia sp. 004]|uniref:PspC domain-containing protein n=1 Tax=Nocardia sp. 004 TaxID=3385978 RepID=UPI0039A333DF
MTRTSFGDQLQQIWQTRPVRLPQQAPVAGVAAGFARRYQVDPVLVRVAFVVSTIFGGAGLVLYLLAWLLLTAAGDQVSAAESMLGKGHSTQSQTKTIVLIVALAISVSTMGPVGVGLGGSGLISFALMLAGWWMLHLRTPVPPAGTGEAVGEFLPDNGSTTTGYPGTAFPPGAPRTAGGMPMPPAARYSPYTRLPDTYTPAPPAAATPGDPEQVTMNKPAASQTTGNTAPAEPGTGQPTAATTAAANTQRETEQIDAPPTGSPVSLGKDDTDTSTPDSRPAPPPNPPSAEHTAIIGGPTPPSWDPLGVAPLAWDLPEPTPVHTDTAPPQRPRSRLTPVVLGMAILAAAGAGAAAIAGVEWMTPARIGAAALAVIGLGLIVGAFLRRGYGLLVITAPLAGFVLLASAVGPIEFNRGAMGEHTWVPVSGTDLASDYTVTLGSGTLDLRSLELTENRSVELTVRVGEARVLLPPELTVRTQCTAYIGEALCENGLTGPRTPGAPVLELNVDVRVGSAEVQRG